MNPEIRNATPWWRRGSTIGCLACMAPFVAYIAFTMAIFLPAKSRTDRENRSRGETIAGVVQQFHGANGRYPATIEELEASGLAPIPKPVRNTGEEHYEPFGYSTIDSGAGFTVSFREAPAMPMDDMAGVMRWSSQTRAWDTELP